MKVIMPSPGAKRAAAELQASFPKLAPVHGAHLKHLHAVPHGLGCRAPAFTASMPGVAACRRRPDRLWHGGSLHRGRPFGCRADTGRGGRDSNKSKIWLVEPCSD